MTGAAGAAHLLRERARAWRARRAAHRKFMREHECEAGDDAFGHGASASCNICHRDMTGEM